MNNWLWLAAALCLGVSLTPWGPVLLYPFTLFTTWIHECGHAVMAVLVGGSVTSITIQPDTSGLTRSLVPASRIAQGLVASSGYLGASIVGCLLMAATRVERRARPILWGIGAFMLLTRRDLDAQPVRRARRARVGDRAPGAGPQGQRPRARASS